jgi:hypothetical protein
MESMASYIPHIEREIFWIDEDPDSKLHPGKSTEKEVGKQEELKARNRS